ncbi:LegC family aminotransferase [Thiomicrorhabdus xiamenensis]|uniref:LegC family aminotransferase n=1 Tax=Thiomicrorhabdus xiamenensis TaxID=2739063 RepID=A0A7D4NLV0_9GAMM|nr:LegC family aminotransferase [Thiomicrorhabdus xiamenensis]QKI89574.1 LegC family aminotransferase [Thiomicrorhabdus xiamenensis]
MSEFASIIETVRSHYGDGFVPLHAPCFQGEEKTKLIDCIDSTFVSSVGKYVDEFERQIAQFTGAKYAVAVVNGTLGLMLAMRVAGIQSGDLVLTQSLSFVATANAISMLGAEPLFLDVDSSSLGMSASGLEDFLATQTEHKNGHLIHKASGKPIRGCVPMHTLGFACEIDAIAMLCQKYGIALIEDAAESLGSFYKGKHTGTFGEIGVFSFNGNKILTTGGGGMLVTDNERLAKEAKHLSTTAKKPHAWLFEHDEIAYNLRMPNLNAALGVAQLQQLPEFLKEKRKLADFYQGAFSDSRGFGFLVEPDNTQANYWLNAITFDQSESAQAFLADSNAQDIQTRPLWTPMHQLDIYRHSFKTDLPITESLASRVVNLPSGVLCRE